MAYSPKGSPPLLALNLNSTKKLILTDMRGRSLSCENFTRVLKVLNSPINQCLRWAAHALRWIKTWRAKGQFVE